MARDIVEIALSDLTVSKLNVRRHTGKDIASLARSIACTGLLYPLIVRATADAGYEIIAGRRRFMALGRLDKSGKVEGSVAPCIVIDGDTDAHALEISLMENTERVPMDELDAYEAFARLLAEGRSEQDIAHTFSLPIAHVRQRLALANLVPEAKQLYRSGDLDSKILQILTLGSKARQRAYLRLRADPDGQEPPVWQLKQYMVGGAAIVASAALFSLDAYSAPITADLFDDVQYLTDADLFWTLQRAEVARIATDLAAKGWAHVVVLDPDQPFHVHGYVPATKAQGGHVVIKLNGDGHVQFEKGLISRADIKAKRRAADTTIPRGAEAGTAPPSSTTPGAAGTLAVASGADPTVTGDIAPRQFPEMTANLTNYIDLVRHSTVAAALVQKPKVALRAMVAQLIAGSPHVVVARDPRTPASPEIAASVSAMDSETQQITARTEALAVLDLDPEQGLLHRHDPDITAAGVLERLMALSDTQVLAVLAVITAETLPVGSALIDALGVTVGADVARHWQPDRTLFDLTRGQKVIEGMAAEVLGRDAPAALSGTQTRAKAIIAEAARSKAMSWRPRWMSFPKGSYLDGRPTRQDAA